MANPKPSGWGEFFSVAWKSIVGFFMQNYWFPALVPAVTVALGVWQGYPWFLIFIGTVVAFAYAITGIFRLTLFIDLQRVDGKLAFQQVLVAPHIANPANLVIGVRVNSTATFPIEFEIAEIRTSINQHGPTSTTRQGATRFGVPRHGVGWYWDNPIAVPNPPANGTLTGLLEYKILYGRPGDLSCELVGRKQVVVAFDPAGRFLSGSAFDL